MVKKKVEKKVEAPKEEKVVESKDEFVVEDPQELRPKELPLIIKPKSGDWKNDSQAEYAAVLNGYAYANPEKWEAKKDVLLENLKEIGNDAILINKFRGGKSKVTISNSLSQVAEDSE